MAIISLSGTSYGIEVDVKDPDTTKSSNRNFKITYYVDNNSGSDSNSGTSAATPFKTLSKINSLSLKAGTEILLRRNVTWTGENLKLHCDGNSTHPISVDVYGSGNEKAKINCNHGSSFAIGVDIQGAYIEVHNLEVWNTNYGIASGTENHPNDHTLIKDCIVHDVDATGIICSWGNYATVRGCEVYACGNGGIGMYGSSSNGISHTIIEDCIAYSETTNDAISLHRHGAADANHIGRDHIIRNNVFYNCPEDGLDITSGDDILIEGNECYGNGLSSLGVAHYCDNVTIRNNYFHDDNTRGPATGGMVQISSSNTSIYNNIIEEGSSTAKLKVAITTEWSVNGPGIPQNLIFSNNNIISSSNSDLISLDDQNHMIRNVQIKNNIFTSSNNQMSECMMFWHLSPGSDEYDIDHNCYYDPDGSAMFNYYHPTTHPYGYRFNLSRLRSSFSQGKNCTETDPEFTNRTGGNYTLKATSPLIDAGTSIPGLDRTSDAFGNPIYGTPDIGAVEYQPPFEMGTDPVPLENGIRLYSDGRFRLLEYEKMDLTADLSIISQNLTNNSKDPRKHTADIEITEWDTSENMFQWVEKGTVIPKMNYTIANLTSSVKYTVKLDGVISGTHTIDGSGFLNFSLPKGYISRTVAVSALNLPRVVSNSSDDLAYTGDLFKVSYVISDDCGIDTVVLSYWFDENGTRINRTMNLNEGTGKNGTWETNISIPSNSSISLKYFLTIVDNDTVPNTIRTDQRTVNVQDNDPPKIDWSISTSTLQPGGVLYIYGNITDNIGPCNLTLKYWFDQDEPYYEHSTSKINRSIKTYEDRETELTFFFNGSDSSGLWTRTETVTIFSFDEEPPEILEDLTDITAHPGGDFNFSLRATDNTRVDEVKVEYWFDEGDHTNTSLDSGYGLSIEIPQDKVLINYIFRVSDIFGNWNNTQKKQIEINTPTGNKIRSFTYPVRITTGDKFTLTVELKNSGNIKELWIDYSWGGSSGINISRKTPLEIENYTFTPMVNSTAMFIFKLGCTGTDGVTEETGQYELGVHDNDPPVIEGDLSNTTGTTGDPYEFKVNVTDNIAVSHVNLTYIIGNTEFVDNRMTCDGDFFVYSITLPKNKNRDIIYHFEAFDIAGNRVITLNSTVNVQDNDPPEINVPRGKGVSKTRGSIYFEIEVLDNIGVNGVFIEYWYEGEEAQLEEMYGYANLYSMELDMRDGVIYFRFIAYDLSGNSAVTEIFTYTDDNTEVPNPSLVQNKSGPIMAISRDLRAHVNETITLSIELIDIDGNPIPEDQYVISWEHISGPGRILDGGSFFSEATGKTVIGFRASCFSYTITDEINITIIQKDPAILGEPVEDGKGTGSDDANRFSLSFAIILAISILIIAAFLLSWSFSRLDIDNRVDFDDDRIDHNPPDDGQVPIEEFEGPQTETISDSMSNTSYPELEEWGTDDMLDIDNILTEIDRIIQDEMKGNSSNNRNNS